MAISVLVLNCCILVPVFGELFARDQRRSRSWLNTIQGSNLISNSANGDRTIFFDFGFLNFKVHLNLWHWFWIVLFYRPVVSTPSSKWCVSIENELLGM